MIPETSGLGPSDGQTSSEFMMNHNNFSFISTFLFQSYAFIRQEQLQALAEKLDPSKPKEVKKKKMKCSLQNRWTIWNGDAASSNMAQWLKLHTQRYVALWLFMTDSKFKVKDLNLPMLTLRLTYNLTSKEKDIPPLSGAIMAIIYKRKFIYHI